MGTLYIVATPIGNLKDITIRALDVLSKVWVIACEDTRRTGLLTQQVLKEKAAKRPRLISYHEHNELQRIPQIIEILKQGMDVALVCDAGTPLISDPGFKLVRECISQGIAVQSVPGPSSVVSALVISGLPTDKFMFLGYLPQKQGKRVSILQNTKLALEKIPQTVILFVPPHKLLKHLLDIEEVFGDIQIVTARELTKIHEEVLRKTVLQTISEFEKRNPKGEFMILFHL